jgi:hypothetical protein
VEKSIAEDGWGKEMNPTHCSESLLVLVAKTENRGSRNSLFSSDDSHSGFLSLKKRA